MINLLIAAFIVGILVPLVTELITHSTAPSWLRSFINLVLSSLVGAVATTMFTDYHSVSDFVAAIIVAWMASMRSHYAGLANPIANSTANFGISTPKK